METEKRAIGRPLKYATLEELQSAIDEYFDTIEENIPTMAGLAYALGFLDRHSLHDYEEREQFSAAIKKARLRVELFWEKRLASASPVGAIFWLKNHCKYQDVQTFAGDKERPLVFSAKLENYGKQGG